MDPELQTVLQNIRRMRSDGAPVADMEAYLQRVGYDGLDAFNTAVQEWRQSNAQEMEEGIRRVPGKLAGAARTGAQGATLYFGDELEGGIRSLLSGRPYTEEVGKVREGIERFREGNPATATALELMGGAAVSMIPFMAATRAGTAGRAISRGAKLGAAEGAVAGAGASNNSNRLTGAALGAGLGGAAGGAIPLFMQAARNVGRTGTGYLAPERTADRMIGDKLAEGGYSPQSALDQMAPGDVVADVSEGTRRLARGAQAIPNETNERVSQQLLQRAQGASDEMNAALSQTLRTPDQDVYRVADELQETLRRNAEDAYQAAYSQPVPDDEDLQRLVRRTLETDWGRRAWREAVSLADTQGVDLSNVVRFTDDGVEMIGTPTVAAIDWLKRGLDAAIDSGFRGRGLSPAVARSVKDNVRNPMVDRLDELVPEYGAARAQYRGDLEARQALEEGLTAYRADPRQLRRRMEELDEGSQEMFRLGFLDGLRRRKVDDRSQRTLTNAFDDTMRERIRVLFGEDRAQAVMDEIQRVANQNRTQAAVMSGSRTTPLAQDVNEIRSQLDPGVLPNIAMGRYGEALGSLVRQTGARVQGVGSERLAGALSNRLFDPNPQNALGGLLDSRMSFRDMLRRRAAARLAGSSMGGIIGGRTGGLLNEYVAGNR